MYNFSENGFKFALSDDGKPIEGFLGDEEKAEVLFILREPHNDNQQGFWFKKVVENTMKIKEHKKLGPNANRYYNILNMFASKILCDEKNMLNCVYFNLFPFNGDARASKKYFEMTKKIKDNPIINYVNLNDVKDVCQVDCPKKIVPLRYYLLDQLTKSGVKHIITVPDIFELMTDAAKRKEYMKLKYNYKDRQGNVFIREHQFNKCEFLNGSTIYEFWHPSYTRINYTYLDEALSECNEH